MKKVFLIALAITTCFYVNAQKKMVKAAEGSLDKGEFDKAYESIQNALNNDETKNDPNTWYVKGLIFQAISKDTSSKYASISENPTQEAYDSYQKAIELDPKHKINKRIDLQLNELYALAANKAVASFQHDKFDKALNLFELALKVETAPIFKNVVDTAMIFNCGLAANKSKNYDKAIEYFTKSIEYKYSGAATYSLLKDVYMAKQDTVKALNTMQKALEAYPGDLVVIVDLVNFYLITNQVKEALSYLAIAKEKEPSNSSFLFAEGTLYEKIGDVDKAAAAYLKATELDPKNFNGYYNLGVLYYNKAVKIFDKAALEKDDAKYNELQKQGDEELKKSIPYLEKAHAIDPKESTAAETLKSLYFRLQMTDKSNALKQEMGW